MIAVTGAAGFIGSVLLWKLNSLGREDILAVDEKNIVDRKSNLSNRKFAEYIDKDEFLDRARSNRLPDLQAILHMGACSSTLEMDERFLHKNNFQYTRDLAIYSVNHGVAFLYASSAATYGDGSLGYSDEDANTLRLKPLNPYGQSKQDFDLWALKNGYLDKITGFKFFNVYGPNEYHKGEMRSVIAKSYNTVLQEKKIRLFKSYHPEYPDGGQKRDFIYVKDAVSVVADFMGHPERCGLFNVGTGRAESWNDLARALFSAVGLPLSIGYIDMPDPLRPRYQYFTEADLSKLRRAGYGAPFCPLSEGVRDYCEYLSGKQSL